MEGVIVKKCTQCTQILSDDTKFCFMCGAPNFEPVIESEGTYQQPSFHQTPAYQAPAYQQPVFNNTQPATIGNFLIFYLLMLIPIFNKEDKGYGRLSES